jgi:hypothetical protein
MDLIALRTAADYASNALRAIANQSAERKANWKMAVSLLQQAVLETQAYVASLDRGRAAQLSKKHRLVRLWGAAAASFYTLDGDLAARLQLKAEYWTQPESWTSQQVRDAGIALEHVAACTRQLLYEGK